MSTFTTYMSISTNLAKYQAMTAADPTVSGATKYFQANIGNITTIDQFVNNPRIFNYAMTAFGLSDMTYAKNLIKQVLQQGVTSSSALANTLNNPKILALATAFNFASTGAATTQQATASTDVVNNYVMQTLETNQGAQNPGVQLALYFQQNASKITNGYALLADPSLLTVAQTTLGISSYTSLENIDTQAAQFNKLINYSDFQNPAKLQGFLQRFAAQYDYNNPTASTSNATNLLNLATGQTSGFSVDLLMSLQGLKLGGA